MLPWNFPGLHPVTTGCGIPKFSIEKLTDIYRPWICNCPKCVFRRHQVPFHGAAWVTELAAYIKSEPVLTTDMERNIFDFIIIQISQCRVHRITHPEQAAAYHHLMEEYDEIKDLHLFNCRYTKDFSLSPHVSELLARLANDYYSPRRFVSAFDP